MGHFALLQCDASRSRAYIYSTGRAAELWTEICWPPVHAPQYIQAGLALDKPLMEWVRARGSAKLGISPKSVPGSLTLISLSFSAHVLSSLASIGPQKLEHYTFRAESSIDRDPHGLGRKVYERLVQRMLQNGTTAASVFGTISTEAKSVFRSSRFKCITSI